MIRYYCDACGTEVSERENVVENRPNKSDLFLNGKGRLCVEIISGTDGTWNHGQLCRACLLKLVRQVLGYRD